MQNYEKTILTFIICGLYILDTICKVGNMSVLYPHCTQDDKPRTLFRILGSNAVYFISYGMMQNLFLFPTSSHLFHNSIQIIFQFPIKIS